MHRHLGHHHIFGLARFRADQHTAILFACGYSQSCGNVQIVLRGVELWKKIEININDLDAVMSFMISRAANFAEEEVNISTATIALRILDRDVPLAQIVALLSTFVGLIKWTERMPIKYRVRRLGSLPTLFPIYERRRVYDDGNK